MVHEQTALQRRVITYEPTLVLFLAAITIQSPMMHQFLYHRAAKDFGIMHKTISNETKRDCIRDGSNHTTQNKENRIQRRASKYSMIATMSYTFPAIFSSLIFGAWSDVRGRRPFVFLPVFGASLQTTLILATSYFNCSVYVVAIGCGLAGVTGYYTTLLLSLLAYIADTTTTERRAFKMGVFEAITFASSVVGLMVSGEWIQHSGYQPPFLFVLVLHIVNMVYITFFLPESLPEDLELASNACSFGNFKSIRQLLLRARSGGRWRLGMTFLVSILSLFTGSTISLMAVLFTKHFPFCWSATLIGFFYGAKSGVKAVGTVAGIKFLRKKGFDVLSIAQIGLLFQIAGLVFIGFAISSFQIFLAPLVGVLCGVCVPCVRAQMSSMVDRDEQGALFAVIASTESLASFCAHVILNLVYSWSLGLPWKHAAGFVFLMNAAVSSIPLLLLGFLKRTKYKEGYARIEDS